MLIVKSLQKEQNSTNDPQSAGINLQSPQRDSTPWTLTLHDCQNLSFILTLSRLERKKPSQYVNMTTSREVQLLSIVLFVFGRLLRTL